MKMMRKLTGFAAAGLAALLTLTGCAAENGAALALGEAMNAMYYGTDTENATAMLGATGAEIRETFVTSAATMLASQFERTDPAADAATAETDGTEGTATDGTEAPVEGTEAPADAAAPEAEGTVEPVETEPAATVPATDGTDESAEPSDAAAAEPVLNPLFLEMGEKLVAKMQTVATYKIKLMTLKDSNAMLKLSIKGMDISDYFSKSIGIMAEMGDITALEEEDYVKQLHDKYIPITENIVAASEPVDLYVNMIQVDGKWQISDLQNFTAQVFQVFVGGY